MYDVIVLKGIVESTPKRASSSASEEMLTIPSDSKEIAVPPKKENQINPSKEGKRRTAMTNSRSVRPLETRAINVPT